MRVGMSWYCREREAHEVIGILHMCKLTDLGLPDSDMCTHMFTHTHLLPGTTLASCKVITSTAKMLQHLMIEPHDHFLVCTRHAS